MSRPRSYLEGLLKLGIAGAVLVGAIAAYRFLVHPVLESALSLDRDTSSIVRRIDLFAIMVLAYWGFVSAYERRRPTELALRWKWTLLAAGAGAASIGVTILAL